MGRVVAPFGVRGWVKVRPFTAEPESLLRYPVWWLRGSGAERWIEHRLRSGRVQGVMLVAEFEGIATRDGAMGVRGAEVGIPREALPAPGPGEHYRSDLVGLLVVNRSGIELGRVTGVEDNGAQPVLRVEGERQGERLIPFVAAYVDRLDLPGGRIEVDWQLEY